MTRYVVDTNVAVIANGRNEKGERAPSVSCRRAAIEFLTRLLASETLLLDLAGAIQAEYRRYLNPAGQPGVGDRFYQEILNSAPQTIERVELPMRADGEYADIPRPVIEAGFDPSDRKFAALAKRENAPVANCADSDWLECRAILEENGINIQFLCGDDQTRWFAT